MDPSCKRAKGKLVLGAREKKPISYRKGVHRLEEPALLFSHPSQLQEEIVQLTSRYFKLLHFGSSSVS